MSFWWHSRFGVPWGTQGHERRGDHHPAEDKGREIVCVLIFMCVSVVGGGSLPTLPLTVPPTMTVPPSSLQSMSRLPIETTAGQWEPSLSPCGPIRSEQWQGKLCHYEMHSYQIILLMYHLILGYTGEWTDEFVWFGGGTTGSASSRRTTFDQYFFMLTVVHVCVCVFVLFKGVIHL